MKNPQHKSNSVHDELTHQLSELTSHDEVAHHVHQHSLSTQELGEGYITQEVHHPDVGLVMRLHQTWDHTIRDVEVEVRAKIEPLNERGGHHILLPEHNTYIEDLYVHCRAPQRVVRVKLHSAHFSELIYLSVEVTQPELLIVIDCTGEIQPAWYHYTESPSQQFEALVTTRRPIFFFDAYVYPSPTLLSHARMVFISAPEQLKSYHSLSQRSLSHHVGAPFPVLNLTELKIPLCPLDELHQTVSMARELDMRRLKRVYHRHAYLSDCLIHCIGESWVHQQGLALIAQMLHPKDLINELSCLQPRLPMLFTIARLVSLRFYGVQDPMETSLCFDRGSVTELINLRILVFERAALYRESVCLALRALIARELFRDAPYLAVQSYLAQTFDHSFTPEHNAMIHQDQEAHLKRAGRRRLSGRSLQDAIAVHTRRRSLIERLRERQAEERGEWRGEWQSELQSESQGDHEELSPLERVMRLSEQARAQSDQKLPDQEQTDDVSLQSTSLEGALRSLNSLNALYLIQGIIVLEGTQPFGLPEIYVDQDKALKHKGNRGHRNRLRSASQQHQRTNNLELALSERTFMWLTGLLNYANKLELSRVLSSLAHLTFYEYDEEASPEITQPKRTHSTLPKGRGSRSRRLSLDDRPMTQDDDRGAPEMCATFLALNLIINKEPLKQPDMLPFLPEKTAESRAMRQKRVHGRCAAWSSLDQLSRALREPINQGHDRSSSPPHMNQALRLLKLSNQVERERPRCAHLLSLSTKLIKTSAEKAKEREEDRDDDDYAY